MRKFTTLLFAGGLGFLLLSLTSLLPLGEPPMLVGQAVQARGPGEVGAANLVTAVVLAYRGMDTLGELSILFAAATAGGLVLSGGAPRRSGRRAGFVLSSGIELLFPLLLVVGAYIILHGHLTPGGGFQGGVILATAFFLPALADPARGMRHGALAWVEGLAGASFVFIGLWALYVGKAFLTPLLEPGIPGDLVSAGTLPVLYLAVGLKVGAELAGLLGHLAGDGGNTA